MKLGFSARKVLVVLLVVAAGCSPVGATGDGNTEGAYTTDQADQDRLPIIRSMALPAGATSPEALADDDADLSIIKRTDELAPKPHVAEHAMVDPTPAEQAVGEPSGTIVAHVVSSQITAYSSPDTASDPVEEFSNPTEHGGPLVFQATGPADDGWVEVLLPIRPNGTTGWVEADRLNLTINPYRIEVDASKFTLEILRDDKPMMSTTVAIGNGATPTPLGRFYLIELLQPRNQSGPYGSYAYGLSGHSDTLDSFNGGDGGIGIHGTNRPDLLGQDVSHGCIRVANPTIEEMVQFLPLGTPVHIFRSDVTAS